MTHLGVKAAMAGGVLVAGLLAGTGFVSAHGGHGVSGSLASVNGTSSIVVKTASGNVPVNLASTTRVIREVAGSKADLKAGTHVGLHLVQGTTTVDAVEVEGANKPQGTAKPATGAGTRTKRHTGSTTGTGTTARPVRTGASTHAGGQVVSLQGNTLMVSGRKGQTGQATTATYTLASNVTITKSVNGKLSDLAAAVGKTVEVHLNRAGNAAAEITILNA